MILPIRPAGSAGGGLAPPEDGCLALALRVLALPLRRPFRHALHERHETRNLLVRASWRADDGRETVGWGEGLPRDYVTGETEADSLELFRTRAAAIVADPHPTLDAGFDSAPALRCAVTLALADLAARRWQVSLANCLPPGPAPAGLAVGPAWVRYSGVLSADDPRRLARTAGLFRLARFRAVKLKVGLGRDIDLRRVALVRRILGRRVSLRVDANCAWQPDEAEETLKLLQPFGIDAVEEPLAPRSFVEAAALGNRLGLPIVLDESMTGIRDLEAAAAAGVPAIANLRISKLGGLDRTWAAAQRARELGIGLQMGCQVGETGILSAAGRAFAIRCAGDLRFAEGSFDRHLLREVPTRPDVTFRWGGVGRLLSGHGLGVEPVGELTRWDATPGGQPLAASARVSSAVLEGGHAR